MCMRVCGCVSVCNAGPFCFLPFSLFSLRMHGIVGKRDLHLSTHSSRTDLKGVLCQMWCSDILITTTVNVLDLLSVMKKSAVVEKISIIRKRNSKLICYNFLFFILLPQLAFHCI